MEIRRMAENRITKINIKYEMYTPIFEHIKIVEDQEWTKMNVSEGTSIRLELSDLTKLYDEKGKEVTTLQRLLNSLVPKGMEELQPTNKTHVFDKPTFIETQDASISKLKIKGINVVISKKSSEVEIV